MTDEELRAIEELKNVPAEGVENYSINTESGEKRNPGNSPVALIIGICLICILLCAGGLFAAFKFGLFDSPRTRVAKAVYNTVMDDNYIGVIGKAGEILSGDIISSKGEVDTSIKGITVETYLDAVTDKAEGKVSATLNTEIAGALKEELKVFYREDKLQVYAKDLLDKILVYDTKRENDGFVPSAILGFSNGTIDDVNVIFGYPARILRAQHGNAYSYNPEAFDTIEDIEFNKIDSREFVVDEKTVKCKGYETVISKTDFESFEKISQTIQDEIYGEELEKLNQAICNLTGEEYREVIESGRADISSAMDRLENIENLKIDFYIYKDMLAALDIETGDASALVEFKGGDKRTSNILFTIKTDEATSVIEKKSLMEYGITEKGELYENDFLVASYEYNTDNGDYEIAFANNDNTSGEDELSGENKLSGKFFVNDDDSVDISAKTRIEGVKVIVSLNLKQGGVIEELQGEEFDIGSAEILDYLPLINEVKESLGGFADLLGLR